MTREELFQKFFFTDDEQRVFDEVVEHVSSRHQIPKQEALEIVIEVTDKHMSMARNKATIN